VSPISQTSGERKDRDEHAGVKRIYLLMTTPMTSLDAGGAGRARSGKFSRGAMDQVLIIRIATAAFNTRSGEPDGRFST
jgi:hypothetical protein